MNSLKRTLPRRGASEALSVLIISSVVILIAVGILSLMNARAEVMREEFDLKNAVLTAAIEVQSSYLYREEFPGVDGTVACFIVEVNRPVYFAPLPVYQYFGSLQATGTTVLQAEMFMLVDVDNDNILEPTTDGTTALSDAVDCQELYTLNGLPATEYPSSRVGTTDYTLDAIGITSPIHVMRLEPGRYAVLYEYTGSQPPSHGWMIMWNENLYIFKLVSP